MILGFERRSFTFQASSFEFEGFPRQAQEKLKRKVQESRLRFECIMNCLEKVETLSVKVELELGMALNHS